MNPEIVQIPRHVLQAAVDVFAAAGLQNSEASKWLLEYLNPNPESEAKCPRCGNGFLYHNCGDPFHAPVPPSPTPQEVIYKAFLAQETKTGRWDSNCGELVNEDEQRPLINGWEWKEVVVLPALRAKTAGCCEVCWTNSFEPCEENAPGAVAYKDGTGFVSCTHCALVEELKKTQHGRAKYRADFEMANLRVEAMRIERDAARTLADDLAGALAVCPAQESGPREQREKAMARYAKEAR